MRISPQNETASAASALFVADGTHSNGGTEFRNLSFVWNSPAAYAADTAINAGFAATLIYRCVFTNCPTAVNFAGFPSTNSPDALASVMRECQVKYESGPDNATCVVLAGQQTGIMGPSILLCSVPTGCTGVAIGGGVTNNEHNIIDGVHFTDWAICVDYADINGAIVNRSHTGCEYTTIANCEMDGYGYGTSSNPQSGNWGACINLTTHDANGEIYGQKIVGNTLSISHHSVNANPVVLIDTGALGPGGSGGPNSNVSSIDLIGNLIFSDIQNGEGEAQPNTYGIRINAGDAIRVIGGKIGNMGTKAGSDGSANICISGNPGSVIIDAVDLRPTFANAGGGATGSAASEYALLVSGPLTDVHGVVRVSNCDLSGYSGNPVGVTGSVGFGSLFITNCTGYNQSGFNIFNGPASDAPVILISASTAASLPGGHNFYGPSTIYFHVGSTGPVSLSINGIGQTFPANSSQAISLSSPYDEIAFGAVVDLTQFVWVGA